MFMFSCYAILCMNDKVKRIELEISDGVIDEVFEKGIQCCAEIEVGEAVECLMVMFRHIQESELVRGFKGELGPEHEAAVDKFLGLLLVSEIATIMGNFGDRENKRSVGEA